VEAGFDWVVKTEGSPPLGPLLRRNGILAQGCDMVTPG